MHCSFVLLANLVASAFAAPTNYGKKLLDLDALAVVDLKPVEHLLKNLHLAGRSKELLDVDALAVVDLKPVKHLLKDLHLSERSNTLLDVDATVKVNTDKTLHLVGDVLHGTGHLVKGTLKGTSLAVDATLKGVGATVKTTVKGVDATLHGVDHLVKEVGVQLDHTLKDATEFVGHVLEKPLIKVDADVNLSKRLDVDADVKLNLGKTVKGTLREVKSILADVAHVKIDAGAKINVRSVPLLDANVLALANLGKSRGPALAAVVDAIIH